MNTNLFFLTEEQVADEFEVSLLEHWLDGEKPGGEGGLVAEAALPVRRLDSQVT